MATDIKLVVAAATVGPVVKGEVGSILSALEASTPTLVVKVDAATSVVATVIGEAI